MVSSELAELVALCDRIVVLADGRVTAELDGAAATEADVLAHALPGGLPGPPDDGAPSDAAPTDGPDPDSPTDAAHRTEAAAP
jgi:hypothetical protein